MIRVWWLVSREAGSGLGGDSRVVKAVGVPVEIIQYNGYSLSLLSVFQYF